MTYGPDRVFEIAIYNQQCACAGQVCVNPEGKYGDDWRGSGDLLVSEGTKVELVKSSRERLSQRFDKRAGGMLDNFDWKCARSILAYLGVKEESEEATAKEE